MAREVTCPRCGMRREWSGNPYRPFCSERCKIIDLGGWLDGKNAIAGEAAENEGVNEGGNEGVRPLQPLSRDN